METKNLISECCKGRITAQKYFFDKYASQMYLLCRRYIRNNELAEEAMMNGFFQCFKSITSFNYHNEASFFGWLKIIFINECLQVLRKKSSLLLVAEDEAMGVSCLVDALDTLSAKEIYLLVTKLPDGYRTVFNLFVIEGYSHKEIGAMLQITEGTSKSQLSKARQMLQQMIMINERNDSARRK